MYLRNKKMEDKEKRQIDIKVIWQALLKHKRLFIKVIVATFVIACFLTLSLPNYYTAGVTLAPEISNKNTGGALSSLASTFGVNLGGAVNSADALSPTLYPDMINSVDFKTSLFPIKIHELDSQETFTYYEYLRDQQRIPWWRSVIKAVFSLFGAKGKDEIKAVNSFMLTKEQDGIMRTIEKKISCDVDKKTNVISINVTDQDPLVAATMADSVKQRLQKAITAYRTSKARVDLEYNKKLYDEVKEKYDVALQQYAAYADANTNVILQRDRNKLTELENEMQLCYQAYTSVAAQLQAAEAKVQEETPAFTTLQNVTVPLMKAGPVRSKLVFLYCFLVFIITCVYVLHKEGYLIPLTRLVLGLDGDEKENIATQSE